MLGKSVQFISSIDSFKLLVDRMVFRLKYLLFFLIVFGCVEPYVPEIIVSNKNLLVVDGFLNSTSKLAIVKLSRTLGPTSASPFPKEEHALVTIEDEEGTMHALRETSPGYYESYVILSSGESCRLHIQTANGKEYQSDFITLKQAPPVNMMWEADNTGVKILVDAHDPSGQTGYYQWLFTDTWEYKSHFGSQYSLVDGEAIPRAEKDNINRCWRSGVSPGVLIASTTKLNEDRVTRFPLTFISRGESKLFIRYSITVEQRALTQEAFNFLSQLKESENVGGLFDPQANPVTGNIFNVADPAEPVLGYFNGGSSVKKRIFISRDDLPDELRYDPPASSCVAVAIPLAKLREYPNSTLIIGGYGETRLEGYLTSSAECIDCRSHGGTTSKPFFWP